MANSGFGYPNLAVAVVLAKPENFPFAYYKLLCRQTLEADGFLNLYVHPWEFTDLSGYEKIPTYVRRHSKDELLDRVEKLLRYLKPLGDFSTMNEFTNKLAKEKVSL